MEATETNRLVIDYTSVSEEIESVLDEIHSLHADRKLADTIGEDSIARLKSWENSIKKRLTEPFSLAVIGDFKRGKSTLINAMLGKAVAPTSVTPETVTINKISYAENAESRSRVENGSGQGWSFRS